MDALALAGRLSHILLAIGVVAGLVGSRILNRHARLADDIDVAWRLTRAAGPFDRLSEVGGPLLILSGFLTAWAQGLPLLGLGTGWVLATVVLLVILAILIPTIYQPEGERIEAALQAAHAEGRVTDELREAWRESSAERIANVYRDLVSPAIIALMVLKPF